MVNFQTDWRMFKYFKPDFYKQFLGKTTAATTIKRAIRNHIHTKKQKKAVTKIQAVVRGKQTRNKQKKGGAKPRNGIEVSEKSLQTVRSYEQKIENL